MIELQEKASNYAEENVINILKDAFARVYADGYRDGYKDREDEIPVDLRSHQTKFVDLGLPSGTLWSADFEPGDGDFKYLAYYDAERYDIPTKEQFFELIKSCKWEFVYVNSTTRKYNCIGPNGNHIVFYARGYKLAERKRELDKMFFWVKSHHDNSIKEAVKIYYHNGEIKNLTEMFPGNMLPLRLVRNI